MGKSHLVLPITLNEETMIQDSLEVIKAVKPHWDIGNVKSKVFTGGISNKLVGFFLDGQFDNEVVMVRLYGQNTEAIIDRQGEIDTIMLLHNNKCGSELFAVLNNGICYEFVHGETLTMETCRSPDVYPIVAKEMAKVHSNIPIEANSNSKMWDKFKTFNDLVEEIFITNPDLSKRVSKFGVSSGFGTKAIEELKEILEAQGMPITFCHNDLLLGNIVYNEKNSKVSFIDFEYAMPNYPPFDVANHFLEFAGIDNPDFTKCPGQEFKSKWIKEYLKNLKIPNVKLDQRTFEKWVELCLPVGHLFWALWAIVQAQNSTIDFDYAGYFGLRYVEYEKLIKEIRENM